jgi:hypothetical protein
MAQKNILTKWQKFVKLNSSKVKRLARGVETSLEALMQDVKFCKLKGYLYDDRWAAK